MKIGQFQVYTGNGKVKTTAALGLALRASGAGLRVYFCQFIKEGEYSEIKSLRRLPGVTVEQFGSGLGLLIRRDAEATDLDCAREGLARLRDALTGGEYDVVIADEINCALMCKLLAEEDLISLIELRPQDTELVFTGRGATEAILAKADLVTEMRMVQHNFVEKRLHARTGIVM